MEKIISGVKRFQQDAYTQRKALFDELATGQSPEVLFITCADSRIDPNLITQTGPGDLFVCRNAGNVVPPKGTATSGITASIEFAVAALKVKHIVICGHTDCGAMKGAMNPGGLDALPHVQEWVGHCSEAVASCADRHGGELGPEHLREVTEENIRVQIQHLQDQPAVAAALQAGEVDIHGWLYDIGAGGVDVLDPDSGEFKTLT